MCQFDLYAAFAPYLLTRREGARYWLEENARRFVVELVVVGSDDLAHVVRDLTVLDHLWVGGTIRCTDWAEYRRAHGHAPRLIELVVPEGGEMPSLEGLDVRVWRGRHHQIGKEVA